MSFKLNLKAKINLDRLLQKLTLTIREPPGKLWLDKGLTGDLLDMTDFEHKKVRDLHLYLGPPDGEVMEVAVLDNELAIYRTTVADVALRRSPFWQEIFSIRNIRKIMNDKDVIISKGKASLKRLHANALALLDLTYGSDDLAIMLEDARKGLDQNSIAQIQESLDLFVNLLGFQPMSFGWLEQGLQIFARAKFNNGADPVFEHIILFDVETLFLGLKKGVFSQQSDSDRDWVMKYDRGEKFPDLQGIDVFNFLAELALEKARDTKNEKQ
ncbi:hypothetical protein ACFL1N_09830 [Thermodesulfobacteriota bacterium]